MTLDVQRCRTELDELQAELEQWSAPSPPGLDLWRHKLSTLIDEILGPKSVLAIRLSGIRWDSGISSSSWNPDPSASARRYDVEAFRQAKQTAAEIIDALRWELSRLAPATDHSLTPPSIRNYGTCGGW